MLIEFLSDLRIPNLVLFPTLVERLERFTDEGFGRLSNEIAVSSRNFRVLFGVFESAQFYEIFRRGLRKGGGKTCMKECSARRCSNAAKLAGSDPRSGGSLPANTWSLPPPRNKSHKAQGLQIQLGAPQGSVTETIKTA